MKFSRTITVIGLVPAATAFTAQSASHRGSSLAMADSLYSADIAKALDNELSYVPGKADTDFALKYGHLSGEKVKTVGEAFQDFTEALGTPINALYKGTITDLVGSLHLTVVTARFQRDAVFSLGLVTVLDLLLKNFPEQDTAKKIKTAMIESAGMVESEIDAEAAELAAWTQGKTREDIESALKGEGDSKLAQIANGAKGDEYWMYSRFFGIGMVKMMDVVGVEQDMSVAYDVMENWVGTCLGKPHYTACADSDLYFKQKGKLDMMETMMKEIEIREKKRMADRLEAKAEMALLAAEKAEKMQEQIDIEAAKEKQEA